MATGLLKNVGFRALPCTAVCMGQQELQHVMAEALPESWESEPAWSPNNSACQGRAWSVWLPDSCQQGCYDTWPRPASSGRIKLCSIVSIGYCMDQWWVSKVCVIKPALT